ncbi:hypothetical protein FEM08_11670 [Flavobacterium gilvum]|nr:hypothetical protein FEM08_11670 [Flavobacterium gilvum]
MFAQTNKVKSVNLDPTPQNKNYTYQHNTNPGSQWFPDAGIGMFIHWGISSVNELDLSWPMRAGTQIGWRNPKLSDEEVKKIMDSGNYIAGHECESKNNCITPNEYFALAKDFNPKNCDPEKWVKAAKDAGMTYAVFTAKHHDGFAMWPSAYGNFNTKNYLGGRDFVKEYVNACRKYGLKVGLYFSPPDWYFDGDFQNFMYYGVARDYHNIPALDRDLKPRTAIKTNEEKQAHYNEVAQFIKGQIEELLINYGKIDVLWLDTDGVTVIPKDNPAWDKCISMDRIRQLQPGILITPRLYGVGDYKTYESDKNIPTEMQDGWAEFCTTIATDETWGYTKVPLKSTAHVLNNMIKARVLNTNSLLNFGPDKEGDFSPAMYKSLGEISAWMKVNAKSIVGAKAISGTEKASVPATMNANHRYLFLLSEEKELHKDKKVIFKTNGTVKAVRLSGSRTKLRYAVQQNEMIIYVPAFLRTSLPDVIDVELK